MAQQPADPGRDAVIVETNRTQLEYFTGSGDVCRGLELPEGILLRYTHEKSLYFYLKTGGEDGKIVTHVYATDSPYDRQKTEIGVVVTPLFDLGTKQFDAQVDKKQLEKIERMLHAWIGFVKEAALDGPDFASFPVDSNAKGGRAY
jgi:hypothetical protein